MGLLGDLAQFAGVVLIAGGIVYMYNRGAFDQILGKIGGEGEGGEEEAAKEEEPKAKEKEKAKGEEIKETAAPEEPDEIGVITTKCTQYGTRCNNECHNGSQITDDCKACVTCRGGDINLRCQSGYKWVGGTDRSKRCIPTATGATAPRTTTTTTAPKTTTTCRPTSACKSKYYGKCDTECKGSRITSSACKDCQKQCCITVRANLALAYAGSYYDGQVIDTAYYVTTPEMMIPPSRPTVMRVALA